MKVQSVLIGLAISCGLVFANASQAETSGLSGAIPDCPSKVGVPFMSIRNLIPDTVVTKIVARPMVDYHYDTYTGSYFTSLVDKAGASVLKRAIAADTVQSLIGEEGDDPNCGADIDFNISFLGHSLYPQKCSALDYENIYELTVFISKNSDRQVHKITMIKNICTETMFDILPGTPTDDPVPDIKSKLAGPKIDDCASTSGQLSLAVRNLIPDTKIIDIKARGYGNYDFNKKQWDSAYAKEGRRILNKTFKNENALATLVGVDPNLTLKRQEGSKQGYCGTTINLARGDSAGTSSCDPDKDNKWNNVFEFVVTLQTKDGAKFAVNYTKDACRETVLDITPGTPATPVSK